MLGTQSPVSGYFDQLPSGFVIKPHYLSHSFHFHVPGNFLIKTRKFRNTMLAQSPSTAVLLTLILCGDVELNPGPVKTPAHTYPCGVCGYEVGWSPDRGVACDSSQCGVWYHISCVSMPTLEYESIGDKCWDCYKCKSTNIDSFTFHSYLYNVSVSNRFTSLDSVSSDMDDPVNGSTVSLSPSKVPRDSRDHSVSPITPHPSYMSEINSPRFMKAGRHSSPYSMASVFSPLPTLPETPDVAEPSTSPPSPNQNPYH